MDRKIELLKKIKDIHQEYAKSDNDRKVRLADASEFVIEDIADLAKDTSEEGRRVAVAWGRSLLCFGDEFTLFEYGLTFDKVIQHLTA